MWAAQAPQSICGYGGMADMFKVRPCLTTVQCTMYIQAAKKSSIPQNTTIVKLSNNLNWKKIETIFLEAHCPCPCPCPCQGPFICNYQAINCEQVFLYLDSTVQTLKSRVSESSLIFLSWNHCPPKTTKCSLNFKKNTWHRPHD